MSRIITHTAQSAPEEARNRVIAAEKANGFLPNLIGVLANAPTALEMYQEVGKINAKTSLNAAEREVVQITAATVNGCGFCVAGHTAITRKNQLLPENVLSAVRNLADFADADAKYNALARFTIALIENKGNVDDAQWQAFLAAGYGQQQAVEVVLGVALATLCNYTNNLAQSEINPQLQAFA